MGFDSSLFDQDRFGQFPLGDVRSQPFVDVRQLSRQS